MADQSSLEGIIAYLEANRACFDREVLRQQLLRDGCSPDLVAQAIGHVYSAFSPAYQTTTTAPGMLIVKDPNTAFLFEFVGGFFGLLGLGHFYVGQTSDGVVRLILWLVYDIIALTVITILSAVIIGLCFIPVQLAIQICVPLWSATVLKKELLRNPVVQTMMTPQGYAVPSQPVVVASVHALPTPANMQVTGDTPDAQANEPPLDS